MHKGLIKTVSLAFVSLLLVTLTGLVGCGGQATKVPEVTFGFLGDLTGPGAYAVGEVYQGFQDYFRMVQEENLIPGLKSKIITYDTRSGYTRVAPGYEWLKGQGAEIVGTISGPDTAMLVDKFEKDKIASAGLSGAAELEGHPWNFSFYGTPDGQQEGQAEVLLQWVMSEWNYQTEGRSPKVGHLGLSGFLTSVAYQRGADRVLAANPGKFNWAGQQAAPMGTSAWAIEIGRLKDCDYILISAYGTGAVSFAKEARQRGYEGGFLSGMEALPGYWGLVQNAIPAERLFSTFYAHFIPDWTDPGTFIADLKEWVTTNRSQADADSLMKSCGYPSGWAWAMWVADAIKRAAENVGAENVDGTALREALASTDMDLTDEGFGNVWRINLDNGVFFCAHTQKVYEWSVADGRWVEASNWIPAPSLAS